MKLSEYISNYRTEHKISLRSFADKCGCSFQYISKLENDLIENPSAAMLKSIASAMGMSLDQLLRSIDDLSFNLREEDQSDPTSSIPETLLEKIQNHMSPVPFYERLCCGNGMFADDQIADYIFFSDSLMNPDKEYFCMTASGDSMIGAQIQDGDYLVFEKTGTPQLNKIGCFCIDDNVATCKKFTQKNGLIILIPANDQFEPIIIDPTKESHFRCVGVLAFVVSDRR